MKGKIADMGRFIYEFCEGCDCVDSDKSGLYCSVMGGGCIKEGHPDQKKTIDYDEINKILTQALIDDNLEYVYAKTDNRLRVVADTYSSYEEDNGEYEFLKELLSHLKGIIVHRYMKEHGYYENSQDEWRRWERE